MDSLINVIIIDRKFECERVLWTAMLQEGKGTDEAIENRNYLAKRMTDEISEVILLHVGRWIWWKFQVMRILEESAQTDNSGKIVNGMNGLNLTEMTFHEV